MSQTLPPDAAVEVTSSDDARLASRLSDRSDQPAVRMRELVALVLMVVLSDVTLFRSAGFAGYAAFVVGAPLLLACGVARRETRKTTLAIGVADRSHAGHSGNPAGLVRVGLGCLLYGCCCWEPPSKKP